MISDNIGKNYAFWDYLHKGVEGGNSRDSLEYQWHKEKQAPNERTYDPDPEKIDFQGPPGSDYLEDNGR